jgi:hypothetical protein
MFKFKFTFEVQSTNLKGPMHHPAAGNNLEIQFTQPAQTTLIPKPHPYSLMPPTPSKLK